MKKWLSYFKLYFIIIGVLALFFWIAFGIRTGKDGKAPARANAECLTGERVFDMADNLPWRFLLG